MASKQTRRSISVRGTTYDQLRQYCEQQAMSMSEVVESQLGQLLARGSSGSSGRPAPVPYHKVVAPRVARASKGDYRTIRF